MSTGRLNQNATRTCASSSLLIVPTETKNKRCLQKRPPQQGNYSPPRAARHTAKVLVPTRPTKKTRFIITIGRGNESSLFFSFGRLAPAPQPSKLGCCEPGDQREQQLPKNLRSRTAAAADPLLSCMPDERSIADERALHETHQALRYRTTADKKKL